MENKTLTSQDIELDQLVFDYVNNLLDVDNRREFELKLENDAKLQAFVKQEHQLENQMQCTEAKSSTAYTVPESNFQKIAPQLHKRNPVGKQWYGMAAAIAMTALSIGLWNNFNEPTFQTLSNGTSIPVNIDDLKNQNPTNNTDSVRYTYSVNVSQKVNLIDVNKVIAEYDLEVSLNENGNFQVLSTKELSDETWVLLSKRGITRL